MTTEQEVVDHIRTYARYYDTHAEPYGVEWKGQVHFALTPRKLVLKICKIEGIKEIRK